MEVSLYSACETVQRLMRTQRGDQLRRWRMFGAAIISLISAAALGGCAAQPQTSQYATQRIGIEQIRLMQPAQPPKVIASDLEAIPQALRGVTTIRLAQLLEREGVKRLEVAQTPLFFETEIGRAYLEAPGWNAIARGEPAQTCPAFGVALEQESAQKAAQTALGDCLSMASEKCGCRLLSLGPILLAPSEEFAHARGQTITILRHSDGARSTAIAEIPRAPSTNAPSAERLKKLTLGERTLSLWSPTGRVGTLRLGPNGAAELHLTGAEPKRALTGLRETEGFRRGRRAEVITLKDAKGARYSLFLGYEPQELEERWRELKKRAARLKG